MSRFEGNIDLNRPQAGLQSRSSNMKQRHGGDLTLTDPLAGLYNTWNDNANPLFDICVDDALIALCWQDMMHPIFDILGFNTSNLYKYEQGYITYIASEGASVGTPASGIVTDPCEPGAGTEFGSSVCRVEGWTRFRRSSETFDVTQTGMKFCEKYPIFTVDGNRIMDDYMWSIMRLAQVQLNDFHTWFLDGDGVNVGETDGIYNLLNGTALDANTATNIPALANYVIDWAGSEINNSVLATATGQRAFAIPDGTTLWSMFRDYLHSLQVRLRWSSLPAARGWEMHFLVDGSILSCLIEAWICETICGGDPATETQRQMLDTFEARALRDRMRRFLVSGAVPFEIDGIRVWFHAYPYGTSLDNGDGTYNMIGFIANVGGQQTLQLDVKDMQSAAEVPDILNDFMVTDSGRYLHFETLDKTCLRRHVEIQTRLGACNKWLTIKIENVACSNLFPFSKNAMSANFLGVGAVNTTAYQVAGTQPVQ
jgi:hypothetical protein